MFKSSPSIKASYPGYNFDTLRETCQRVWWKNLLYVGIYTFGLDESKYPRIGVNIQSLIECKDSKNGRPRLGFFPNCLQIV